MAPRFVTLALLSAISYCAVGAIEVNSKSGKDEEAEPGQASREKGNPLRAMEMRAELAEWQLFQDFLDARDAFDRVVARDERFRSYRQYGQRRRYSTKRYASDFVCFDEWAQRQAGYEKVVQDLIAVDDLRLKNHEGSAGICWFPRWTRGLGRDHLSAWKERVARCELELDSEAPEMKKWIEDYFAGKRKKNWVWSWGIWVVVGVLAMGVSIAALAVACACCGAKSPREPADGNFAHMI